MISSFIKYLFCFLLLLNGIISIPTYSQCVSPGFALPSSACLNENINMTSVSVSGNQYEWDFCEGDLTKTPTAQSLIQVGEATQLTGVDAVYDGSSYFMFVTGRTSNTLVRLDFGNSPKNTPTKVNLGNLGSILNGPIGIKMVKEGTQWYGIIYNSGNDMLVRVSFGTSLSNGTPTAQTVVKAYGGVNNGMDVGVSNNNFIVVMTNPSTNKLTLINFGNSLTNTPVDPTNIKTTAAFSGASSLRGISLIRVCDKWYGYAVTASNRKIYRLDFGSDLNSLPTITDITGAFAGTENFVDIKMYYDAGSYVGFIMTTQRVVYRLDFGSSPTNLPTKTSIGNLSIASGTFLFFDFIKKGSEWYFFAGQNEAPYNVYRSDFPNSCSASLHSFSGITPGEVSYNSQDNYYVTLTTTTSTGDVAYLTKQLSISSSLAPNLDISSEGICQSNPTQFMMTSDLPLSSITWDFDDGNTSNVQNPTHTFTSTGEYSIKLNVEGNNGCKNISSKKIEIYSPPNPDFNIPSGLICTNQAYLFENSTIDNFDGHLEYQWLVDDVSSGIDRDLNYSFFSNGSKTIKLVTSLPGCELEVSKLISMVNDGPEVDFFYTGNCEGQLILFESTLTGDISSIEWDFGDNSQANGVENPTHAYVTSGEFNSSLKVGSPNGCMNTKNKTVTIYSNPQTNFSIALPPFSCSGSLSQFYDTTPLLDDSNLTFWLWDFGNGNTSLTQNPQFLFNDAGDYNVSLTVGSNFGCETTFQKTVTIQQTPVVVISKTPACQYEPVQFSASANVSISNWEWKIEDTYYYTQNATHLFSDIMTYPVSLKATGENSCVNSTILPITIHQPLSPNFVVQKNCNDQDTEFTNSTVVTTDPINSSDWIFGDGGVGQGSPAIHTFQNTGNVDVMLTVTTVEGCQYSGTKSVSIVASPQASFVANPDVGLPPLAVQFNNTSTNATNYLWQFNDENNTTSIAESPTTTFFDYGTHIVDLTAYNSFDCSSTYSGMIEVQFPLPDVAIGDLIINETQDGFLIAALKITNKGNTTIHNLKLNISLSGIVIQKVLEQDINPGLTVSYLVDFSVQRTNQLDYLCITAELADDVNPDDNQLCTSYDENTFFFIPYPNPTQGVINIDWIAPDNQQVHITIYDRLGNQYSSAEVASVAGINQLSVDLTDMAQGIYYVVVRSGQTRKTFPIMRN